MRQRQSLLDAKYAAGEELPAARGGFPAPGGLVPDSPADTLPARDDWLFGDIAGDEDMAIAAAPVSSGPARRTASPRPAPASGRSGRRRGRAATATSTGPGAIPSQDPLARRTEPSRAGDRKAPPRPPPASPPVDVVWSGPEPGRPPRAHWRGSGGRWLVWAGRAVIWAVILVIGYRGVLAIVTGPAVAARISVPAPARVTARPAARKPAVQFPSAAAEAFALEFGNVYLNFSPQNATARAAALAAFLPASADPQLGWNGAGTQTLADEQVAGITVGSAHDAVVRLLARLGSGRLIELGVPVYAAGSAMTVPGQPALLPGPSKAAVPAAGQASGDQAAEAALRTQLAGFFPAYAASDTDTLDRFLAPGTHLAGLGGAVRFGGIDAVFAPAGGARRVIEVTVTWQLPGLAGQSGQAGLPMTYQLTVVRRDGNWDISAISAAAQGLP